MMHKKARKQFAEDKQTKDMDYWNHVLLSDETKINVFGSDGVKRVWRQPGEKYKDKCVLPTITEGKGDGLAKHVSRPKPYWAYVGHPQMEGGGAQVSNIHQLWDVITEEWKRTPVATCEALVNSMPKRVKAVNGK